MRLLFQQRTCLKLLEPSLQVNYLDAVSTFNWLLQVSLAMAIACLMQVTAQKAQPSYEDEEEEEGCWV